MQIAAALNYRSFEKRQGAEGLAPNMFNSTANRYFEQRMKLFGAMDYDEMLSAAENLLATNERALELARRYHAHVLVDEFQV
jgi:superfamily I DNA/RNA helicase